MVQLVQFKNPTIYTALNGDGLQRQDDMSPSVNFRRRRQSLVCLVCSVYRDAVVSHVTISMLPARYTEGAPKVPVHESPQQLLFPGEDRKQYQFAVARNAFPRPKDLNKWAQLFRIQV